MIIQEETKRKKASGMGRAEHLDRRAFVKYLCALLLFGLNGIVANQIALNSYEIVFLRTLIGSALLSCSRRFRRIQTGVHHPCARIILALDPAARHRQYRNRMLYVFFPSVKTSAPDGRSLRLPGTSVSGAVCGPAAGRENDRDPIPRRSMHHWRRHDRRTGKTQRAS